MTGECVWKRAIIAPHTVGIGFGGCLARNRLENDEGLYISMKARRSFNIETDGLDGVDEAVGQPDDDDKA